MADASEKDSRAQDPAPGEHSSGHASQDARQDSQVPDQADPPSGQGAPTQDGQAPLDRDELRSFLATAPEGLRQWAGEQLTRLGAGPEEDPAAPDDGSATETDDGSGPADQETAEDGSGAASGAAVRGTDDLAAPDAELAAQATEHPQDPDDPEDPEDPEDLVAEDDDLADIEDVVAEDDDLADIEDPEGLVGEDGRGQGPAAGRKGARGRDGARRRPQDGSSRPASARDHAPSALQRRTGVSRLTLVLVMLLSAAVVIIIQQAGRDAATADQTMPANHPSVGSSMSAEDIAQMDEAQPVDSDKEASLKAEAQKDPQNIEARQELGLMYLRAALYQDASTWLQQILDVDPDNMDALLAVGYAQYQLSDYETAEKHWRHATEVSPDTADAWYYLGFLYMAQTPPDTEQATQCWDRVLEIDPDSEMAETVRSHRQGMGPEPSSTAAGTSPTAGDAAGDAASPAGTTGTPAATPSSPPTATSGG